MTFTTFYVSSPFVYATINTRTQYHNFRSFTHVCTYTQTLSVSACWLHQQNGGEQKGNWKPSFSLLDIRKVLLVKEEVKKWLTYTCGWFIDFIYAIFSYLSEKSAVMIKNVQRLSERPLNAEPRWRRDSDFAGCSVNLNPWSFQLHFCKKANLLWFLN